MVKTVIQITCDRCGVDISEEYVGHITILVKDGEIDEIEPEGKTLCKQCMMSYQKWLHGKKV